MMSSYVDKKQIVITISNYLIKLKIFNKYELQVKQFIFFTNEYSKFYKIM